MNNIFNIQRFLRLFNKQTKDNYKTYLMSLAVMVGLLAITMGIGASLNRGEFTKSTQAGFYIAFLILAGTIFTSMVFADLGDKKKAIPALTLPVSHLEKFIVGWLYSFLIFQLAFTLCFFAVDFAVINITNSSSLLVIKNEFVNTDTLGKQLYIPFIAFAFLHSVTFLGAIYFERLHFIKSSFALFIFIFLVWLVDQPIANLIFGQNGMRSIPFGGVTVEDHERNFMITSDANTIIYLTLFAVTFLLWTAAFFKLKEKQV